MSVWWWYSLKQEKIEFLPAGGCELLDSEVMRAKEDKATRRKTGVKTLWRRLRLQPMTHTFQNRKNKSNGYGMREELNKYPLSLI